MRGLPLVKIGDRRFPPLADLGRLAIFREPVAQVVQRAGEVREVGSGLAAASCRLDVDGFLGGGQGLLALSGFGQPDAEVVQRHGQVGEVGVGVGGGELPVDGRRLPGRGLGPPAAVRPQPAGCRGCSATWPGRGGRRRGCRRRAAGRCRRLPGRGQGLLPLPGLSQPVAEVVQRRWRGRGGRRRDCRAASWRQMSAASWAAARASCRCPVSASRLPRLFSDLARSGR